jgi:hypothetical protein
MSWNIALRLQDIENEINQKISNPYNQNMVFDENVKVSKDLNVTDNVIVGDTVTTNDLITNNNLNVSGITTTTNLKCNGTLRNNISSSSSDIIFSGGADLKNSFELQFGDTTNQQFSSYQILLGFNNSSNFGHFLTTSHNGGTPTGNNIKFYTSNGNTQSYFPGSAIKALTIENGSIEVEQNITAKNSITTEDLKVNQVMVNKGRIWTGVNTGPNLVWTETDGNSIILSELSQTGTDYVYRLPTDPVYDGMIFLATNNVDGPGNPALKIRIGNEPDDLIVLGPKGSANAISAIFLKGNGTWYVISQKN